MKLQKEMEKKEDTFNGRTEEELFKSASSIEPTKVSKILGDIAYNLWSEEDILCHTWSGKRPSREGKEKCTPVDKEMKKCMVRVARRVNQEITENDCRTKYQNIRKALIKSRGGSQDTEANGEIDQ